MTYNPNFQWKMKTVTISVPTSDLPAGYQVKLTIPKETDMQSDFRDLRFETIDGYGLSYWIESIVSNTATVWVKLKDVVTHGTGVVVVINMYYGNPYVQSASNINTFGLFDDFNDGSKNTSLFTWIGTTSESGGYSTVTGSNAWNVNNIITNVAKLNIGEMVETRYHVDRANSNTIIASGNNTGWASTGEWGVGIGLGGELQAFVAGVSKYSSAANSYSTNDWVKIRVWRKDSSNIQIWKLKEGTDSDYVSIYDGIATTTDSNSLITFLQTYAGTPDADYIIVRKYVATEPATPTIGSDVTPVNWNPRRKPITITSSSTTNDYQVKLTIPFSSEMNNDFSDLRFVTSSNTPLSYWIESSIPGQTADIWVKTNLVTGSNIIYMHYGNQNLTSASDGVATFVFFDDFNGNSVDTAKWTNISGTVANSIYTAGGAGGTIDSILQNFSMVNNILETKAKEQNAANTGLANWRGVSGASEVRIQWYGGYGGACWVVNNGTIRTAARSTLYTNYEIAGIHVVDTTTVKFYKDYTEVYSYNPPGGIVIGNAYVNIFCSTTMLYTDWVRIRKYIANESTAITFSIGSAESMNTFSRRKKIIINNSSAAPLTDYQVPITVAYDSDMQTNFNDIRFVDSNNNNNNLLPYWIESKTDSVTASIWIKVNLPNYGTSPTGDNTVYMYYGNSSIPSASDGYTTFIDFAGFETSFDGYTSDGTRSTTHAYTGSYSWTPKLTTYPEKNIIIPASSKIEAQLYLPSGSPNDSIEFWFQDGTRNYCLNQGYPGSGQWGYLNNGTWANSGISVTNFNTWQKISFTYNAINNLTIDVNAVRIATSSNGVANVATPRIRLYATSTYYIDNIFVRKYASPEPTVATFAEQLDTTYLYRKLITINNTSGNVLTNYQIAITVNTSELIHASPTSKMKSACEDIRFTSDPSSYNEQNWSISYPYWIESGINSSSTKIWVKVDSIATGSNTIYMYYGNAGATAASNGNNTFLLFDHFDGISLDTSKWYSISGYHNGTLSVANSLATISGNVSGQYDNIQSVANAFTQNTTVEALVRFSNDGVAGYMVGGRDATIQNQAMAASWATSPTKSWATLKAGVETDTTRTTDFSTAYKKIRIDRNGATSVMYYADGTLESTVTTNVPIVDLQVGFWAKYNTNVVNVDYVFVRKCTSTEPSTSLGSEAAAAGTLNISSVPTGAQIFIDSADQFITTPNTIAGITIGSHSYKLTLSGYADATGSFSITYGQTTTLSVTFAGSLNISSTPSGAVGASVYIDGNVTPSGVTPLIVTGFTPVTHTYRLTKTGYTEIPATNFSITAGQTTTVPQVMLTVANITATNMIITPSESPCRVGICTVTIVVTWTNSGETTGSITPNIKIDNVSQTAKSLTSIPASDTTTQTWTISGLSAATHAICPDPN